MTAAQLDGIARRIYGPRYRTSLAEDIGVNESTIRRWLNEEKIIPHVKSKLLLAKGRTNSTELLALIDAVESEEKPC